ncbi:MAG: ceramidase domain-containing protein [Bacteroidetes bacterium]|nr:ceramidase domain-containing protein [Bacteroidota bacterium]
MKLKVKSSALLALTAAAFIVTFRLPAIPQPPEFHQFADARTLYGIPNFFNVVSNLPFLLISVYGWNSLRRNQSSLMIRLIYSMLFLGIALTAFGSAYYHYNPGNKTLVWDRLPLTTIFMAATCAAIAELVSERLALFLLFPLLLTGAGSVIWWSHSQEQGHGDLRLYFLVQYYPMVLIPTLLLLYYKPVHKPVLRSLTGVVGWYVIAKIFEHWDIPVYRALGISGHTLKHLAAAVSTGYFVVLYKRRSS